MITHSVTLLSGVTAEFKEFTGKHQEILSKNNKVPMNQRLDEILADIVVRVGSVHKPDITFIKSMLSADKKKLLVSARMESLDHEPTFNFDFEYEENGETKKLPLEVPLLTTDAEGNEVVGFKESTYKFSFTEYSDVLSAKKVRVNLPKSGKVAEYTLLDGFGESRIPKNEEDLSANTPLLMRNVCIIEKKESGAEMPIQADLRALPIKDLEAIRASIRENEAKIDTEVRFTHPATGKPVVVDMLNTIAFFFPSQAI